MTKQTKSYKHTHKLTNKQTSCWLYLFCRFWRKAKCWRLISKADQQNKSRKKCASKNRFESKKNLVEIEANTDRDAIKMLADSDMNWNVSKMFIFIVRKNIVFFRINDLKWKHLAVNNLINCFFLYLILPNIDCGQLAKNESTLHR